MKKDNPVIDQTLFDLKLNEASFYAGQGLYDEADKIYIALIQELKTLPVSKNTNIQIRQLESIRKEYQSEIKNAPRIIRPSPTPDKAEESSMEHPETAASFNNGASMEKDRSIIMEDMPLAAALPGDGDEQPAGANADIEQLDNQVSLFIHKMILDAHEKGASDIHMEPSPVSGNAVIRFRLQGVCNQYIKIPDVFCSTVVSSIKAMGKMDMACRHKPLEGKISLNRRGDLPILLRVIIIPTTDFKEDVVLKFIKSGDAVNISHMGLLKHNYDVLLDMMHKSHGLILVAGQAGSGTNTALHSLMNQINTPEKKIWSVEEPVEIVQKGIRQSEVHAGNGLDTATYLRSFLRADPDVIMVGRVKEPEACGLLIDAALTGHLVLAGVHSNSALEAIDRIIEMSGHYGNVAHSLRAVLAQRLVKKLCDHCKKQLSPSLERDAVKALKVEFGKDPLGLLQNKSTEPSTIYEPVGCSKCSQMGYQGWIAIQEVLLVDDALKQLIREKASIEAMDHAASEYNMYRMKQDAILKLFSGLLDQSELQRICV